jgi:hypothetical protein
MRSHGFRIAVEDVGAVVVFGLHDLSWGTKYDPNFSMRVCSATRLAARPVSATGVYMQFRRCCKRKLLTLRALGICG